MRFAVLGLGEAGSLFAADLATAGHAVSAYDPGEVPTPDGVVRCADIAEATGTADIVLVITPAADATQVVGQTLDAVPAAALVADLSTSAPADKAQRAEQAAAHGLPFVDVALMTPVPGAVCARRPSLPVRGPSATPP